MPDLDTEYRTRQQPAGQSTGWQAVSMPLPAKTLARRKRVMRYGGVVAVVLCLGLSAIPGPKGSSHTIETISDRGVKTQVQRFFFSRHIGLPFTTGRADYGDDGSIDNVRIEGQGFLGNFVVALAIVIAAGIFIGRRRRDD